MKRFVKILGTVLGAKVLILLLITVFVVNCSPQFGGSVSKKNKKAYEKTGRYNDGKFENEELTEVGGFKWSVIRDFMRNDSTRKPSKNIEVEKIPKNHFSKSSTFTQITWFGHSAFLIEIDGKKILIDPMLGKVAAPFEWAGSPRFNKENPITIEELPFIDAVIISHDHYDHLDYPTIQKLKGKVGQFYMPLGVGAHFKKWGIPANKIHELNWWDEIMFDNIKLVCTPSRHFSGRGLFDRYSTLWSSWIIKGTKDNIYFSGDGGYGSHFKEIGKKYGPFDVALMECGQYNEHWAKIHMMPEETAQAGVDVKAKLIMPIHWGAFTLALHSWTDPIERLIIKAKELNVPLTTPKIGEVVYLGSETYPNNKWWEEY